MEAPGDGLLGKHTSVLQENIQLVKFLKATSGIRMSFFFFHNLTSDLIDDTRLYITKQHYTAA